LVPIILRRALKTSRPHLTRGNGMRKFCAIKKPIPLEAKVMN
jgi:hypothetical protein